MHYTIYKITNKLNGKTYIGMHQTKDLDDDYMGSGKHLTHAQRKYGMDQFEKEIVHVFKTHKEMVDKEMELVTEDWCLRKDTYNIRKGGKGGFTVEHAKLGRRATDKLLKEEYGIDNPAQLEHVKQKVSSAIKHHWSAGTYDFKNQATFSGKKHSLESKKLIGEANSKHQKGPNNSQFGTIWITNGKESKKIKKDEEIPIGWIRGRKS